LLFPREKNQEKKIFFCFAEEPKDTRKNELIAVTYKPTTKTFEQDIMDTMGIVETRKPIGATYWY
jgi:hypothetical protein